MNTINRARNILETSMNMVGATFNDLDFDGCKELMSEIINEMETLQTDFTIDILGCEVRVICEDEIDTIMWDELESELYVLGCIDAGTIADATNLPIEMITACKEAGAFEALGKGIVALEAVEALQEALRASDGYGHHFGRYDGNEANTENFFIFRTS